MSKSSEGRCLSSNELVLFVQGKLTKSSDDRVLDHLETCGLCTDQVQMLEEAPDGVLRELQAESVPDPYLKEKELKTTLAQVVTTSVIGQAAESTTPAKSPVPENSRSSSAGDAQSVLTSEECDTGHSKQTPRARSNTLRNAAIAVVAVVALASAVALLDPGGDNEKPADVAGTGQDDNNDTEKTNSQTDSAKPPVAAVPAGFRQGTLSPDDAIHSVRVLIETGADGAPLMEPVNLHLGFGFPLRLYPLGTTTRQPSFAAFPQATQLPDDATRLDAGKSAWFTFNVKPEGADLDELGNTPALLSGLKVGDIRSIGFASRGETNWILRGYEIRINDALFAAHGDVNADPAVHGEALQIQLEEQIPALQELEADVALLQTYVDSGLAGDKDVQELKTKKKDLAEFSYATLPLAGQLAGTHPWFVESSPKLAVAAAPADAVSEIVVQATTADAEHASSRNHLFLQLGPRKYPITSEVNTLKNVAGMQEFRIRPVHPPSKREFASMKIGMLGADDPFNSVPDRACLQRITVHADGETVFDSEASMVDRTSLPKFRLIPPTHRDNFGDVVKNESTEQEIYVWKPGTPGPPELPVAVLPSTPTGQDDPAGTPPIDNSDPPTGGPLVTTSLPREPEPGPENSASGDPVKAPQAQPAGLIGGLASLPPIAGTEGGATGLMGGDPPGAAAFPDAVQIPATQQGPKLTGTGLNGLSGFGAGSPGSLPTLGGLMGRPHTGYPVGASPGPVLRRPDPLGGLLSAILRAILKRRGLTRKAAAGFNPRPPRPTIGPVAGPRTSGPSATGGPLVKPYVPAIYTKPTRGLPQISNVRIQAPRGMVVDGRPITVHWQTEGDTSGVSHYRVDLNAVVPHDKAWFIPTPVARRLQARYSGTSLTPDLSLIRKSFTDASDLDLLYVQPKVTAVDKNNQTIGSPELGPILPIAPSIAATTPPIKMHLVRGFEIDGDGFSGPWNPYQDPPVQSGRATAWLLQNPQSSHTGLLFDFEPDTPNSRNQYLNALHNVAVYPSTNSEQITIRFDVADVDLQRDMRLIAHIGFINGSRTAPATGSVLTRLVVSDPNQPPTASTATPNDGNLELLRIQTPTPISFSKREADGSVHLPMQVIEMPIRLNLSKTEYTNLLPSTHQSLVDLADPAGLKAQSGLTVAATFLVQLKNAALSGPLVAQANKEAIGIFGVRLIPGTNPGRTSSTPLVTTTTGRPIPAPPIPPRPVTIPAPPSPPVVPMQPGGTVPVVKQLQTAGALSPERAQFLKVHNDARAAVGVTPLRWSDDLAHHAQQWADELARRAKNGGPKLAHRQPTTSKVPVLNETRFGENLAWSSGSPKWSAADGARGWLAEKSDYEARNSGKQVGHYTQAVWAKTTHVGYGIARVGNQTWVVASYEPGGNFVGQFPYPGAPHKSPAIDPAGNPVW